MVPAAANNAAAAITILVTAFAFMAGSKQQPCQALVSKAYERKRDLLVRSFDSRFGARFTEDRD
jgi:hypothetical protein